ncbi:MULTISPECIES: DEAD/DEAH box helicase [unclassified Sphingobium]|uniref:DEAD/DEAH box helicase n=1 Tax=unclassified Sphingobium TaxID=2611147 RepID=UPI0022255007|nr:MULTISPECIES: DEAD/DEAH box helicase [unclassified Sphingobium]MCW2349373.1 ATP-dependent RNA helicase RhlE [Sphingobium sp. B12D2B]MCW2368475.1 ATP-dependent RNA helicase RhlE [Sphingobium sp. B11D3D]
MSFFNELGLAEPILRALETKGYADPTPIQQQAIPALMQGRDLLGIAQTGTGKTAAFSLPSLHRLFNNPQPRKPASCRMLVLSPTRELAAQIAENMRGYAKYLSLNVQVVFGGVPVGKQARALVPGTDILVATPGRLLDLIDQRALTLRNVEIFVLDEADQMMDLGFIKPLTQIAKMLPAERQSLFFSATMPQAIAELGKRFINDPVKVEVAPQSTTAERVEQYATFIDQKEKQALLTLRLRDAIASGALDRALVFTRTKHGADRVARHLVAAKISAAAIHGNKSQGQRTAALQGFRTGGVQVLVATDIAARGIDVSGVSHVFNFELPNVAEQYVHRIGRTARAGADGIAMSFVAPDEKPYLRDIEKLTRVKLAVMPLPEDFVVEARRLPLPSKAAVAEAVGDADGRRQGRGQGRDQGQGRRPASQQRRDRPERGRSDDRREAGAGAPRHDGRGEGRGERPARFDHAPGQDGQRRNAGERGERPFRGERDGQTARPARAPRDGQDAQRSGQRNPGGRYYDGHAPNRPGFDPLAQRPEPAATMDAERLPKRLRPVYAAASGEQRQTDTRSEGDRSRKPGGQRPRHFGGGRPQGNPGGGRRSGAGRAG